MSTTTPRLPSRWSWADDPVFVLGLALVLVQMMVRGAALYNGWFYGDDFEFLKDSAGRSLSWGFLMTPHDSQLMPAGILTIWGVGQSGTFNWPVAATAILAFQLCASVACWWMLCRVFGVRWWCLALLAFYLFSSITLTAFMWWSVAINQVPCQLAFFLALTFHVDHLRHGRRGRGVLAVASVAFGLLFYVKALLVMVPIAILSFAYFTPASEPLRVRLRLLATDHWRLWVGYLVVTLTYLQYYIRNVPNPISADGPVPYGDLSDNLVRVALGPAMLGGPWRWTDLNPPLGLVDTPAWAVTMSWVAITVGLALAWRRHRLDWRGLLVLVPYLLVSTALVARGRASLLGGQAGLELRYLADAAPIIVLCGGLLIGGRRGLALPPAPSRAGPLPLDRVSIRTVRRGLAVMALVLGVGVSTVSYVRFWTSPYPARAFVQTVIRDSVARPMKIADVPVPGLVLPGTSYPDNLPSRLFAPLGRDRVEALTMGTDLDVLDPAGERKQAIVNGASSLPGPAQDCGYIVSGSNTVVGLDGAPPRYFWWMQVSYLASKDGRVHLAVGDTAVDAPIRRGLHRLLVQGEGGVSPLEVRSTTPGLGLCVDTVTVGDISAMEAS